ncbi:MAG: hypothetical protein D6727_09910 [Gammaproteobacteria bacterium]|nr:MAG: hypothetical protein D6727_09910 [Gammaproteobacteria bacterium]
MKLKLLLALGAGLLLATAARAVDMESLPEFADRFECAHCHTNRLKEFRRKRALRLVEPQPERELPTGRQNEVSTPAMCFSCHDGYVMDSRSLWQADSHAHPLGMAPSAKIRRPEVDGEPVFPMNEDGRMYCGSCHSPHNHEAATKAAPDFMRVDLKTGDLCLACHTDKVTVLRTDHVPRSSRRKRRPADFTSKGPCARCHIAHNAQGPLLWRREPGPGNTTVNTLCNSCHEGDVKPSQHPPDVVAWSAALRSALVDDSGAPMPVFDAHASQSETGAIGCPTCHNPHQQRPDGAPDYHPGKFLRRAESAGLLCADCHGPSGLRRYQFFHSATTRKGRHQ